MRIRPDTPVLLMLAKACNIILLTLVWAVCCAPVVTIGAATTALYTVMWRISAGQDVRVIREFWDAIAFYVMRLTLQSNTSRICRRCSISAMRFANVQKNGQPQLFPKR